MQDPPLRNNFEGLEPESRGQNLAVTVLRVPSSLDSRAHGHARRAGWRQCAQVIVPGQEA